MPPFGPASSGGRGGGYRGRMAERPPSSMIYTAELLLLFPGAADEQASFSVKGILLK